MTYRAYLRGFDGQIIEKTIAADASAAMDAFSSLVNRTELDGQKLLAALTYRNRQIAYHRFDRQPGDADYWRDRLNEIQRASGPGQAGRPSKMEGGKRVQVYLDTESIAVASRLGEGNISEGIRKALKGLRALP
ncbi:hypothetical protein [Ferrovum sp.]|jgi:hypothetical protein|uniref:hypothetical protein n=1 Tax=Ferrovum sp. TaxID=2609467 RepID=UPI002633F85F|nr:hypothetical protein [Ferrovum sp.]